MINSLERVGGELNAFTTKEHTVFYSAILRDHFAKAVDLLTDIVFHSCYPQAEIDKEVEVICDEIESYNDSPAELIYDEFESIVFGSHPLGRSILGRADRLRTYTTADAMRFTRRLTGPTMRCSLHTVIWISTGWWPCLARLRAIGRSIPAASEWLVECRWCLWLSAVAPAMSAPCPDMCRARLPSSGIRIRLMS